MPTLYNMKASGNCYKIRLLCAQIGQPLDLVEVNIFKGETHTPEFLSKNPQGRIPLLELDDGRLLPESNAMLLYFAEGTPFLPDDRFERAQVYQWLFFEQNNHEPNVAVARRWWTLEENGRERMGARLSEWQATGRKVLEGMDRHLSAHEFFAGGAYTIADIALYAYTHLAEEGGFDLSSYPAVQAWLARVAAQPGHITITA